MKLKNITLFFFLLFFSIETNLLFPASVFAQTSTDSATTNQENTLPINPSPQIPSTSNDTSLPPLSLTTVPTGENNLRTSPVVQKLAKKYYRSDENVHVAITNPQGDSFHVSILDPQGKQADVAVQQVTDTTDQVAFDIAPRVEFSPGKYILKLTDKYGKTSQQDFTWGVLAINMDRSVYTPGQTAHLSMAVLDEEGNMVCDAKLQLAITTPTGVVDTLATDKGTITVNDQCGSHNFSLTPDYQAIYLVKTTGNYDLTLTAQTKNGSYSITDKLVVDDTVPFDVERISATRIYPPNNYPVQLNVTANQDFNGTITETVPQDFTITSSDQTHSYDNLQTVYLNSQNDPATQLAKQVSSPSNQNTRVLGASTSAAQNPMSADESTLVLPFTGSFPITEGFGAAQTDPSLQAFYQKYGLAGHDGIDFGLPVGTQIRAVDDGNIVLAGPGDYGITIVIQHSWGKSYYGHLSKVLVGTNQHVTKGQAIAISGDTGEATGPHLHFGMKPNIPDMLNGYFGKIDPLPFFHLPSNAEIALGTQTQIATAVDTAQVLGASTSAAITTPQLITDTSIPANTILVNQVTSQALDLPTTPVNNKVKVLSWHVSLKKGDKISLGYTFKAPLVSPQFYLLGPLSFYPTGSNKRAPLFAEQRQWQIAADAVGVAWYNYNWQFRKQITVAHSQVSANSIPTLDAVSFNTSTSSSITLTHTVGSESNMLLIVGIATNKGSSVSTVTWDTSEPLTMLSSIDCGATCHEEFWYEKSPSTGTHTISVAITGATTSNAAGASSYYNVNLTTPFGTAATNVGVSTTPSVTVTTTAGQLVVDMAAGRSGSVFTVNGAQTQVWNETQVGNRVSVSSNMTASGTSTTMNWTQSVNTDWVDIGVGINGVSSSSLSNFPVFVNLTSDSSLSAKALSNGNDILFTDATGQTLLPFEIQSYASGNLNAWVNISNLSSSTDTSIYMYYGNAANTTSLQNVNGTWNTSYVGVWHFANTCNAIDSTSNGGTGTANSGVTNGTSGPTGGVCTFDGLTGVITVPSSTPLSFTTGSFTYSAWVKLATNVTTFDDIIYKGGGGSSDPGYSMYIGNGPNQEVGKIVSGTTVDSQTNTNTLSTGVWTYYTVVVDKTSNLLRLYDSGIQNNTVSISGLGSVVNAKSLAFGAQNSSSDNLTGSMDEVEISNTALSAGWIQTEYNNQNSPSTFYTVGSVETPLTVPTLDQLMRGGKWFCPASECATNPGKQPFTF